MDPEGRNMGEEGESDLDSHTTQLVDAVSFYCDLYNGIVLLDWVS